MKFLARLILEATLMAVMLLITLLIGLHYGEKQGMKKALSINPVSEELEMTCAGLWVGEQNKKAWKKENAR